MSNHTNRFSIIYWRRPNWVGFSGGAVPATIRVTGITKAQIMTLATAHLIGDAIPCYQWIERTMGELSLAQFTRALYNWFGELEEPDAGGGLSKFQETE